MSKKDILEIGVKLVGFYIAINAVIELFNFSGIYLVSWYSSVDYNITEPFVFYIFPMTMRFFVGVGTWFLPNLITKSDYKNSIDKNEVLSIKNVIVLFVVVFCFYTSFQGIIYLFQIIVDKSFYLRTSYDFQTKYPDGTIELTVFKIVFSLLIIFYSDKIFSFVNRKDD